MVYEYADPKTATIPQTQRSIFMETLNIPRTWTIWAGLHDHGSKHPGMANHLGMIAIDTSSQLKHFQSTGFTVGKLFIQTYMSSPLSILDAQLISEFSGLYDFLVISPNQETITQPKKLYSTNEAQEISCFFAKRYGLRTFTLIQP
jgi:hypothetical protein